VSETLPRARGQKATSPSSSMDCSMARTVLRTSEEMRSLNPAAASSGAKFLSASVEEASAMRCSVQP
jgi:hypothetical protein